MASVIEVLPLPPCPKKTTFRISPVAVTVKPPTTFPRIHEAAKTPYVTTPGAVPSRAFFREFVPQFVSCVLWDGHGPGRPRRRAEPTGGVCSRTPYRRW